MSKKKSILTKAIFTFIFILFFTNGQVSADTCVNISLTAPQTNLYKTAAYTTPLTFSNGVQAKLAPQTVTVIQQNGDWYNIKTSLGNAWINLKTPVPPLTLTAPQTNLYKTAAYTTPMTFSNGMKATLAPQTVTVVQNCGDWYNIKTSLGNAWINVKTPVPPLTLTAPQTNLYKTAAYTIPMTFSNGVQATLAPQTVTVIKNSGDWYNIKTSLGNAWINLKTPIPPLTLTAAQTNLYKTASFSNPLIFANGMKAVLTPQTVKAVRQNGDWYQINTYLGYLWVNIKNPTGSALTTTKITLTTPKTNLYQTASYTSQLKNSNGTPAYLTPQGVTVLSQQGDWYQISSYLGKAWVNITNPTGPAVSSTKKITLTALETNLYQTASYTTQLKNPNGIPAYLTPQEVTVVSQQGDWYQINTYLGKAWVNTTNPSGPRVSKITLKAPQTNLYQTASFTSQLKNTYGTPAYLSPQEVTVVSQQGDWYQINTSLGKAWVNIINPKGVLNPSAVYDSNNYLTLQQRTVNAQYIYNYLKSKGWTKNAICAVLGNMETESTINPGLWQGRIYGNMTGGFGLVQWTPATKYIYWANKNGLKYDNMNSELNRMQYEVDTNNDQWINRNMTFKQFTQSKDSANNLAMIFLSSYERPKVPNQPNRGTQAEYWYNALK